MRNRFILIVNEVNADFPEASLPNLLVARVVWGPKPNLETAVSAWILAGRAHLTVFSYAITPEFLEDFAEMINLEYLLINDSTEFRDFKKELKWNDMYFSFKQ